MPIVDSTDLDISYLDAIADAAIAATAATGIIAGELAISMTASERYY